MRVVQISSKRTRRAKRYKNKWLLMLILLVLAAGTVNYVRPLPPAWTQLNALKLPVAAAVSLKWPAAGQAAVGSDAYGVLSSSGVQTPLATASIAKLITALCVLQKYPLSIGQPGPILTISDADVALYNATVSTDGSNLPVTLGEKLTEYQTLQALLLPSANNIADTLALWAFGSQSAYAAYANQFLQQYGLTHSHVGSDASGFDPSTTSTAGDLTRLGLIAARNPVIMQIAGQKSAELPVAGTVRNYNTILGVNGITGLKTGNNTADLGAFLFTANVPVGAASVAVAGAVMGASSLHEALASSAALVGSLTQDFTQTTLAPAGQTIGKVYSAWGGAVPVITGKQLQLIRWKAAAITEQSRLLTVKPGEIQTVGSLEVASGDNRAVTELRLRHPLPGPSFWWRLTRQ